MIFEDALKLLREGKKIRHNSFKEGQYLLSCYVVQRHHSKYYPQQPQLHTFKLEIDDIHPNIDPDYDSLLISKHCFSSISVNILMSDEWEEYIK